MESLPNSNLAEGQNQPRLDSQHFFAVAALLLLCLVIGAAFIFWQRQITLPARRREKVETRLKFVKEEQVVGGFPLSVDENSGLYHFYGVLDGVVQLKTPFELPTGEVITTLARVYYLDAQGVEQMVYAPFFSYDEQRMMWHVFGVGNGSKEDMNDFKNLMNRWSESRKSGLGPMTIDGLPPLDYGQIIFLGFNTTVNPDLSSAAKEMFADAMSFYTQAQLDEFARTGDPSVLPQVPGYGPLLIPLSESESNRLQNELERSQL